MTTVNFENTYWNNKGKYPAIYETLQKRLVPSQGVANTYHGNLLRSLGNVYHDVYNNGGYNFGANAEQRRTLAKFLAIEERPVYEWLLLPYKCECDLYGDECGEECDCPTGPEFTQQLVDGLEQLANLIIEFAFKQEIKKGDQCHI